MGVGCVAWHGLRGGVRQRAPPDFDGLEEVELRGILFADLRVLSICCKVLILIRIYPYIYLDLWSAMSQDDDI